MQLATRRTALSLTRPASRQSARFVATATHPGFERSAEDQKLFEQLKVKSEEILTRFEKHRTYNWNRHQDGKAATEIFYNVFCRSIPFLLVFYYLTSVRFRDTDRSLKKMDLTRFSRGPNGLVLEAPAEELRANGVLPAGVPHGRATLKGPMAGIHNDSSIRFSRVHADAEVPLEGLPGTKHERTFIAIKPDGVNRGIIGNIIARFEDKGFKLVAMKLIVPTEEQAAGHYADLSKKAFFPGLIKFFSSGPIIAMVWEGKGAVKTGRKMLGETNPADSAPGSIRGDLCIEVGRNICHGSDSNDSAAHEINFWFKKNEVFNWKKAESVWVYEK